MHTLTIDRKISCSCLKNTCDNFAPSVEDVKARFYEMFPGFKVKTADWDDFRAKYIRVTNLMARETAYYQALPPADKARADAVLEDSRCGICGARLLKALMEDEEEVSFSIFDLLRRSSTEGLPPVTRCVEGLRLPA